jgi:hypothetical protein
MQAIRALDSYNNGHPILWMRKLRLGSDFVRVLGLVKPHPPGFPTGS